MTRQRPARWAHVALLAAGIVFTAIYLASKWTFWEVVWWRPSYSLRYRNGYLYFDRPQPGMVTQFKFESDGQLWRTGYPASMSNRLQPGELSGFAFARYADWSTPGSVFGGYLPLIRTSPAYACVPMGSLAAAAWIAFAGVSVWRRRRSAGLKGCCGACGYRLGGLPVGAVCPECGGAHAAR